MRAGWQVRARVLGELGVRELWRLRGVSRAFRGWSSVVLGGMPLLLAVGVHSAEDDESSQGGGGGGSGSDIDAEVSLSSILDPAMVAHMEARACFYRHAATMTRPS
eukprot:COSAG01_NODE_13198_length_1621_cov_1.834428_3_plen_106_part_00